MRSYICYVHTPSAMTPHMRVVNVAVEEEFTKAIRDLLEEWPSFELVDVYDETDRLVLRMAPGEVTSATALQSI